MASGNMKIKIINSSSLNNFIYTLKLYDINNNLVHESNTINNESLININKGIYKVYIFYGSNYLGKMVIKYKKDNEIFVFKISKSYYHQVIFRLLDYNYDDLKIEKGNIILWPIT